MLIDGRTLTDNSVLETGVVIVGGGIAGITLALEFNRWNIPVCLLEAGGVSYNHESHALYAGEVTDGLDYDLSSTRTRYLGGSSNCWCGWCRPFGSMDLARRDWVENSGWPISANDFAPHYARARDVLKLTDLPFDPHFWIRHMPESDIRLLPLDDRLLTTVVNHCSPAVRLGESRRAELEQSLTTKLVIHATASAITTDPFATHATGVRMKTMEGKNLVVKAKFVLLAAGGIENARLLLLSNDVQKEGLGNGHDVVGRYFMDHPRICLGRLTFHDADAYSRFYDVTYQYNNDNFSVRGTRAGATIGLSEEVQRSEKLLQCHTALFGSYIGENSFGVASCRRVYTALKRHQTVGLADYARMAPGLAAATTAFLARSTRMRTLVQHYILESVLEPVPDRESRVTLSNKLDALGQRRARLKWRVGELEKKTHRRAIELIKQQVESLHLGRLEIDGNPWDDQWERSVQSTCHHMGTTRMHSDPRFGVVDENCNVHGVANLFVAGSSVFPTGGSNMPTINLVALAVRLAEHVKDMHEDYPVFDLSTVQAA
ncbi:MAG TPA: GMC family oxidoreductase [Burkholderiales bacterium]|nr:GMC family oxidoreductase [Burkholderiales bacterium]